MNTRSAISRWLTRLVAVAMIGSLASLGSLASAGASGADDTACFSPPAHEFSDISPGSYYELSVSWVVAAGITNGVTPDRYAPNANVTRAQMAQFLWRAAGSPEPAGSTDFDDVSSDDYFATAVSWLVESGITAGVAPGRFGPNKIVTRGQMAQFLWKAAGSPDPEEPNSFDDVSSDDYFDTAVSWLVESGITSGVAPGRFAPNDPVTRGQMAVFLHTDACGPRTVNFASAAYGNIHIDVLVPGDAEADPPTEDQVIPVDIPVTGQALGLWARPDMGRFGVKLALDSGSFPLTVPGIGVLTVSYSVNQVATGAGQFDPETGDGGFDINLVFTVDGVDLLGPIPQPCELGFGMSLDGEIDAATGMMSASQEGFEVTPPVETGCGGLGGVFGDLLGGPDNSVNLNFLVGTFRETPR